LSSTASQLAWTRWTTSPSSRRRIDPADGWRGGAAPLARVPFRDGARVRPSAADTPGTTSAFEEGCRAGADQPRASCWLTGSSSRRSVLRPPPAPTTTTARPRRVPPLSAVGWLTSGRPGAAGRAVRQASARRLRTGDQAATCRRRRQAGRVSSGPGSLAGA
jgi:hypothetical protein